MLINSSAKQQKVSRRYSALMSARLRKTRLEMTYFRLDFLPSFQTEPLLESLAALHLAFPAKADSPTAYNLFLQE
jgi:hypothetical protein